MAFDNTPFETEGVCSICGAEGAVTCIGEDEYVCSACLESAFTQCEICGQYYGEDVDFSVTEDGRLVCEYCLEDLEAEDEEEE